MAGMAASVYVWRATFITSGENWAMVGAYVLVVPSELIGFVGVVLLLIARRNEMSEAERAMGGVGAGIGLGLPFVTWIVARAVLAM